MPEETERLRFAIKAAGVGFWEVKLSDNTMKWDGRCKEIFGLPEDYDHPYTDAFRYIHPEDVSFVTEAIRKALSGYNNGLYDARYRTIGATDGQLRWVHFSGRAYFNEKNEAIRFGGIAQDITELQTAIHKTQRDLQETTTDLKTSESKLRDVIDAAPAAMVLFAGKDLVVEMPNQAFLNIAGRGREITGKPLREAMPELNDQPFIKILNEVYATGKRYENTMQAGIIQDDVLIPHFFNFSYTPLFDAEGKVFAILDISVDVTEEMKARQKIEEGEIFMRAAVDLAQLGTWTIDIPTKQLTYSARIQEWYGYDAQDGVQNIIPLLNKEDQERVDVALTKAMTAGSDGLFDEEFTVTHPVTGRKRVIHSQGKAMIDEAGTPLKIIGTAQDITVHRQVQLALEQEIQQRTEELDVTNEELQAANEELGVTNEELAELNENLLNSNQDLQQFAHVASHDLKEPLRKIKVFLSRLEEDTENTISQRSQVFMQKITLSADRMFSMIEGVLSYSKLNATEQFLQTVDINVIINNIIVDLEVLIAQKRAVIEHRDLPVIDGSSILIYQLFYNLLINSLKFSRGDEPALIKISSTFTQRKRESFCRIEITDNGIGFDQKNAEKIFGSFIRLNPKDQYEGTGLGLSLCKKIVQRHHGTIEAFGIPGEGARFVIHLPVKHLYLSI